MFSGELGKECADVFFMESKWMRVLNLSVLCRGMIKMMPAGLCLSASWETNYYF